MLKMFVTHGSILIFCTLILAGKEGQEILGPEAQADEAGCAGTLLSFSFILQPLNKVFCVTGFCICES